MTCSVIDCCFERHTDLGCHRLHQERPCPLRMELLSCKAALDMLPRVDGHHRITATADRAYDTADFVAALRAIRTAPQAAQNATKTSREVGAIPEAC